MTMAYYMLYYLILYWLYMYGEVISVFLNMTLYLKPIMSEIHASVFVWVNVVVEPPIPIGKKVLRNRIPTSDVLPW